MVFSKRRAVPVVNRNSKRSKPQAKVRPRVRVNSRGVVALAVVVVVVLLVILLPLRIYMQQRAEIVRVTAQIQANEAEKQRLLAEIEKYNNPAYVQEQARARLGVIEPGELAFRVIDPSLQARGTELQDTTENLPGESPWFEQLWDSVTIPEPVVSEATPEMQMPLAPVEEPPASE